MAIDIILAALLEFSLDLGNQHTAFSLAPAQDTSKQRQGEWFDRLNRMHLHPLADRLERLVLGPGPDRNFQHVLMDIDEAGSLGFVGELVRNIQRLSEFGCSLIYKLLPLVDDGILKGFLIALGHELETEFLKLVETTGLQVLVGLARDAIPVCKGTDHVALMDIVERLCLRIRPDSLDVVDHKLAVGGSPTPSELMTRSNATRVR